jgi:signal transduction histidine kinase
MPCCQTEPWVTGIGFTLADLRPIFRRLHRGDPAQARRERGGGRGLGIAQWTMDTYDRRLVVEHQSGRDSTVLVLLPACQEGA